MTTEDDLSPQVRRMIADAHQGRPAIMSDTVRHAVFDADETRRVLARVEERPEAESFHLLAALRQHGPEAYSDVPAATRARVWCAALATVASLDDWGYLDPAGSWDGPAATALVETGREAVDGLTALLDDARPAPLSGSETATMAEHYDYRRRDFAYRYLCLVLGRDPVFDADPVRREEAVAALRRELSG